MSVRIAPAQIQNLQQIEAAVAGPDGANRLFTVAAQFDVNLFSQGTAQQKETFTALIGPVLTRQQFHRAISTASIVKSTLQSQTASGTAIWSILGIDADWDDESGQVELRIEASVFSNGTNNSASIGGLAFNATILCAVTAP